MYRNTRTWHKSICENMTIISHKTQRLKTTDKRQPYYGRKCSDYKCNGEPYNLKVKKG